MGTHTIRLTDYDYEKAKQLMQEELKKSNLSEATQRYLTSETAWISYLVSLGIKLYKADWMVK